MTNIKFYQFDSGQRLLHLPTKVPTAYFGVVFGIGSRDELANEHGLAHFVEHMLFKGTKKRSNLKILNYVEDVGGTLDAYTTKEFIVISSCVPKAYFNRTIKLLSDIIFNSQFPEDEIENERNVILEEIKMYNDNPAELIFDVYDEYHFAGNSIGRNILGEKSSLEKFQRSHFINFWKRAINPNRMVICTAGDFSLEKVLLNIRRFFPADYEYEPFVHREIPVAASKFHLRQNRKTHQIHCLLGVEAIPAFHERSMALRLVTAYLGGNTMNSQLNLLLREKYGLVYDVEAFFNGFSDCGLFGIYFGCDHKSFEKCLKIIHQEIINLTEKELTNKKLTTIKKRLIGQLICESENYSNILFSKAKTLLITNKTYTQEDIIAMINSVSVDEVRQLGLDLFSSREFSTVIFE